MAEHQRTGIPELAPDEVEILLRAQSSQLQVVRGVAADMALRADFDLDTVEDMKLAVDELVSALIRAAAPGCTMSCRFRVVNGGLRVHGQVPGVGEPAADHSFSWRVLSVLSDDVRSWTSQSTDGVGPIVHIEMERASGIAGC